MLNWEDWFREVSKTKETREWYESKLDIYGSMKLRVFFIIEMQTIKNASLLLKGSSDVEAIIRAKVPVSQMLGDPGVLSRFLDPAARADIKVIKASGQKFSIGEAVYGVRYAEVRFEYLSSIFRVESWLDCSGKTRIWKGHHLKQTHAGLSWARMLGKSQMVKTTRMRILRI